MNNDFLNRVQRELSAQEIEGLKTYRAVAVRGSLVIMPQIMGYGESVRWECRVYLDGVSGPLHLSDTNIQAIGAPDDWVTKAESFRDSLQRKYSQLPGRFSPRDRRTIGPDRKEINDGRSNSAT